MELELLGALSPLVELEGGPSGPHFGGGFGVGVACGEGQRELLG